MKEIKEDTMKDIYSWIGRHIIIKMFILHKTIYMFNEISRKISIFFTETEKNSNSKVHKEYLLDIDLDNSFMDMTP